MCMIVRNRKRMQVEIVSTDKPFLFWISGCFNITQNRHVVLYLRLVC